MGNTQKDTGSDFSDSEGSLSKKGLFSTIEQANARVATFVEKQYKGKRGIYQILTPAKCFCVGKRASEYGMTATLRYYSTDLSLKEMSV